MAMISFPHMTVDKCGDGVDRIESGGLDRIESGGAGRIGDIKKGHCVSLFQPGVFTLTLDIYSQRKRILDALKYELA